MKPISLLHGAVLGGVVRGKGASTGALALQNGGIPRGKNVRLGAVLCARYCCEFFRDTCYRANAALLRASVARCERRLLHCDTPKKKPPGGGWKLGLVTVDGFTR